MRKPTGVTAMAVMLAVFLMGDAVPAKTTSESMPEPIQKLPVLGSIQWQNQPLPFVSAGPRAGISGSGMVVHGGRIYLMGGFIPAGDETESTSRRTSHWTHRYDLQTGKWERLADMPGRREYTRAIVAGDAIYVMGGGCQGVGAARRYAPFADCFRLDLSQDPPVWTEHSQLTVARTHMGTGLIGSNLLVVVGGNEYSRDVKGYHKSTIRDTVDIFDLSQPGRGWQKRAALPGARAWVASSVSGGRLYVFGGFPSWPATRRSVSGMDSDTIQNRIGGNPEPPFLSPSRAGRQRPSTSGSSSRSEASSWKRIDPSRMPPRSWWSTRTGMTCPSATIPGKTAGTGSRVQCLVGVCSTIPAFASWEI